MMTDADVQAAELACHRCGYDLRAQPSDGKCPEFGASVAESLRLGAMVMWPAWHDRDPRWRRRIVAGAWVLALLPLMALLRATGWAADIAVPSLLNIPNATRTLDQTFVAGFNVYEALVFCVGAVLLFSGEQKGTLMGHSSLDNVECLLFVPIGCHRSLDSETVRQGTSQPAQVT